MSASVFQNSSWRADDGRLIIGQLRWMPAVKANLMCAAGGAHHPWRFPRVMPLEQVARIETDLFEHRMVKPHFTNPCCFGEDFAGWLRAELSTLSKTGLSFSEPIQEDYGWGFWAKGDGEECWIAISYVGTGSTEGPAEWMVSVAPTGKSWKSPFKKVQPKLQTILCDSVRAALARNTEIKIIAM